MSDILEFDGRTFTSADEFPLSDWPYAISEFPRPTLTLKNDDLFLITDTLGNMSRVPEPGMQSLGLFCRDTRFLSRLELQVEGQSPIFLSSSARRGYALSVLCANPYIDQDGKRIRAETIGIQREIVINGGCFEELIVTNYSTSPVCVELSLSFDADFADLFEIRGFHRTQRGRRLQLMPPDGATHQEEATEQDAYDLTLAYQGLDGVIMESQIRFSRRRPDTLEGSTAVWQLELQPHQTQHLEYRVRLLLNSRPASLVSTSAMLMQAKAAEQMEEHEWRQQITQIRSDNRIFNQVIEQAERDVYLLRQTFGDRKALAAGVPWFSTLFGRDAIIAASQSLILDSAIARETLAILAKYQGQVHDELREEEPGKILHELRLGELARCNEVPHTPYYGTVDATPLWLMLYAEYYFWTKDQETLERLWPNALAAMAWIDRNCQETGYLIYNRHSAKGLRNQGWKDSGDCIVDGHGRMVTGAIALCEVQGYAYAAKVRLSELAHILHEDDLAKRWLTEAKDLKRRFNRDFWLPDHGYCALALDGDGKPVDSITSNPGHCLYLGILETENAHSVAERLQAPDMFSGWGIRTLSSLSPAYNPMGYHVGSVWPHDNGIITMGLRSLGLIDQALEIAQSLIDMTLQQPYLRPPELFCGYERMVDDSPIHYPVACSPQAWATGAIFQLIQMMVNLVPNAPGNSLRIIDPALLPSIGHISIHNLRVGTTLVDLEFGRGKAEAISHTASCQVARKRGNLRVVIET
jgi:glycogen debranching enzyme